MDAIDALPEARELLADRGYDADWSRDALLARGITPCIPPRKNRKRPISYDKTALEQEERSYRVPFYDMGKLRYRREKWSQYETCDSKKLDRTAK